MVGSRYIGGFASVLCTANTPSANIFVSQSSPWSRRKLSSKVLLLTCDTVCAWLHVSASSDCEALEILTSRHHHVCTSLQPL